MPTNECSPVIDFIFKQLVGEAIIQELPGEPGFRHTLFETDGAEGADES